MNLNIGIKSKGRPSENTGSSFFDILEFAKIAIPTMKGVEDKC